MVVNLGSFTICFDNMDSVISSGHAGAKMNQHEPAPAPQNLAGNYIACDP